MLSRQNDADAIHFFFLILDLTDQLPPKEFDKQFTRRLSC